ncbi:MAG TPA: transposase [Candidatus Baltobacteraceae bacterium]|nr:transposase [Candidatus Baltobacteraceae bacterium]
MPFRLKRIYGFGDLHFITFSCYRRWPLLGSARARTIFVKVLSEVRDRFAFGLIGYVVMPEHVHLLISEPKIGKPSTAMQMLKQRVSRLLNKGAGNERSHAFWETRFYDFNVRTKKKKVEKLVYMHLNPVKRGLVDQPEDWIWSSYSFYQEKGEILIAIDRVE